MKNSVDLLVIKLAASALSALQDVFSSTHTCSSKANSRSLGKFMGKQTPVTKLNQRIILLFLCPVGDEDGSTKGAATNLLHNLLLIHP